MKALIIKDIINLKKQFKFIVFFIIFYSILLVFINNDSENVSEQMYSSISSIAAIMVVLCNMQIMTSFSWDEYFKWDRYAVCLPITRTEIVMSKYILMLLLSILGACFSFILALVIGAVKGINIFESLTVILSVFCGVLPVSLVFVSLVIPLVYKFGVEKGRTVLIASFLIASLLFVFLVKKLGNANIDFNNIKNLLILIPILSIAIMFISFKISCIIYKNKEL